MKNNKFSMLHKRKKTTNNKKIMNNKNKINKIIISILILFVLSISITSVSAAADVYVSTSGSDSASGDISTPKATLKNATSTVNNGGNVYLKNGTYTGTGNINIGISKNLNYIGESRDGVIIDANKAGYIFDVKSGYKVTFINITFKNAIASQHHSGPGGIGAAIYNYGTVNVTNCNFINNTAVDGGAISNHGSFSVTNSNFINNNAINVSSGFNNYGGAIYNFGKFNVTDSNFTNNSAICGGAIYSRGSFNVSNSNFIGNIATDIIHNTSSNGGYGGAIAHDGTTFTVINSNFTNNAANSQAGAINNYDNFYPSTNNFTVINSIFTGNWVYNTNRYGGAILSDGRLSVINSNFTDNNATIGGAISNGGILNVESSNFISNGNKNGIADSTISHDGPSLIVKYSNFLDNEGGIYSRGRGNTVLNYNRFYSNGDYSLKAGGNVDANFNWWGENSNPINTSVYNEGGKLNLTYWYVLELSLNNTFKTHVNATKDYNFSQYANLTYSLALNTPTPNNATLLPYFKVTVLLKNKTGVVNNVTKDVRTTNLSYEVAISSLNNLYSINALSDGEDVILSINGKVGNHTVNVGIVKVANTTLNPHVGDNVSYKITVTNNGANDASGVIVTENIDYNKLKLNNFNTTKGTYDNKTGIWYVGNLRAGETAILSINATFIAKGTVTNSVNLTTDQNNANNKTGDSVTLNVTDANKSVNVNIVKVANASVANVGDTVVYTIVVSNNGLNGATGVVVTDGLDYSKLQFVSASNASYDSVTGKWNVGNLAAGKSLSLNITVLVIGTGSIVNVANVTTNENNVGNPRDNVTFTSNGSVNVNIVKVANASVANVGDTVVYTIVVSNNGLNGATGVVVTDGLDYSKLQFVSASNASYDSVTGRWNVGSLAAGKSLSLNITVLVIGTGSIVNVANVTTNENNAGNPRDNVTFTSNGSVNVNIVKVANASVANVGDAVVYTIVVSNVGSIGATGVVVTDGLDYGKLQFVSASNASYDSVTGRWNVGSLAAGNSLSLNITVLVTGAGSIVNVANVTTNENNVGNPNDIVTINSVNSTPNHNTEKENVTTNVTVNDTPKSNPKIVAAQEITIPEGSDDQKNNSEVKEPTENISKAKAAMKKTGVPLTLVIIIISIIILAIVIRNTFNKKTLNK
ncbi:beta strand repeat-containing protein [Methanobrevibacter filiformis]|uniref:Large cysteine-rich periplasmic protein omcB n=1 Tax=Methanobrevibacter filiformis TaxID=55758 RepID=A0A166CST7_9EURY|nr:DUF11 domain-containing protein [Methanobrevibacter filiformis]KZX16547.1 large cysteine-rich periplasmic protein omcB precursor [Methanobrevibacter filiformis]